VADVQVAVGVGQTHRHHRRVVRRQPVVTHIPSSGTEVKNPAGSCPLTRT
jgi:hypothetical protein